VVDPGDISDIETRPHGSLGPHESASSVLCDPELDPAIDPIEGWSRGRYLVLEQVGSGGMGRVFRAYDPKLQREVALKLLHTHVLGAEAQARLVREARAMAMLSHPNVVAVHDVDDTPAGVMLVMELVPGQTLRAWLRASSRPWSEIVARFREAGRGLAAAHAAGLLHRDFKPSNVLVPERGAAKVTDFGLAKLDGAPHSAPDDPKPSSSARASLDSVLTVVGEVVGTPRYMPPEQHRSEPLGPAADQYAFCVSLWEALTGKAPFQGNWDQLAASKRKGPPVWPSGPGVPSSVVAAVRRGLAARPNERWPSMGALLDALDPTERRSPLRWLALGVAIVGLAVAGWRAWAEARAARCSGGQAQLDEVWGPTRRSEVLAAMGRVEVSYATRASQQTADVIDRYAEDWVAMYTEACEATTVRGEQSTALMDLRMTCLQQLELELGAVTAVLADADAEVMQRVHELTAGLRPLSRCEDIEALQAEVEPPPAEEAVAVGEVRARLAEAKALHVSGRYAAAQAKLDAAKQRATDLAYGPVHTEVALLEGINLVELGRLEAAEAAFHRALELGARWKQLDAIQEASVHLIHVIGSEQQRFAEGLQHRDLALGLAADNPRAEAMAMTAVANVLQREGRHDEAEAELRRALALQEDALEPDHSDVAMTRANLANVLLRQGRYDEAEAENRRVLALRERALGPDHPDVAMSRNNLANVLRRQGRHAEAEAELRHALAVQQAALGPDHPDVAKTHNGLGNVLEAQGKHAEAEVELRQALALMERTLGPEHPDVGTVQSNLGNVLFSQGKHEAAEAEFRRALVLLEKALGPDHPTTAMLRANHAEALHALGKHREAELEHRRAITRLEEVLGSEHPELAKLRVFFAATLAAQGQREEAEAELRRALVVMEKALGSEHADVAMARTRLAELLLAQGRAAEALELDEQAESPRD